MKFKLPARAATRGGSLVSIVILFVLPSLPMWLLSSAYFIDRPVLSLDAVIAAAVCVLAPLPGLLMLAVAWLADLVVGFSATYQFTRPGDFLAGAAFLNTIQLTQFLTPALVLAAVPFALSTGLIRMGLRRFTPARPLAIALLVGLAAADAVNGSSLLWQRDTRLWPGNLTGSPVHTLFTQLIVGRAHTPAYPIDPGQTSAATVDVEAWARGHPQGNIVFVVVESFGLMLDEPSRTWMSEALGAAAYGRGYRLLQGSSAFRGATTSGEMRQLCTLAGHYSMLTAANAADCLPRRLQRLGWKTVGVHGFSREMFARSHWWPTIGIGQMHFGDDADLAALPRCGAAFRGACDGPLVRRAFAEARAPGTFVYLLTLNSHLPLEQRPIPAALGQFCTQRGLPATVCQLQVAVAGVLADVADAVRSAPNRPLVVVVGDHAPPFASTDARSRFDAHHVPVLALVPSDDGAP